MLAGWADKLNNGVLCLSGNTSKLLVLKCQSPNTYAHFLSLCRKKTKFPNHKRPGGFTLLSERHPQWRHGLLKNYSWRESKITLPATFSLSANPVSIFT